MCVTFLSLVKCVCVASVAIAGRRYTYTVCTYFFPEKGKCGGTGSEERGTRVLVERVGGRQRAAPSADDAAVVAAPSEQLEPTIYHL